MAPSPRINSWDKDPNVLLGTKDPEWICTGCYTGGNWACRVACKNCKKKPSQSVLQKARSEDKAARAEKKRKESQKDKQQGDKQGSHQRGRNQLDKSQIDKMLADLAEARSKLAKLEGTNGRVVTYSDVVQGATSQADGDHGAQVDEAMAKLEVSRQAVLEQMAINREKGLDIIADACQKTLEGIEAEQAQLKASPQSPSGTKSPYEGWSDQDLKGVLGSDLIGAPIKMQCQGELDRRAKVAQQAAEQVTNKEPESDQDAVAALDKVIKDLRQEVSTVGQSKKKSEDNEIKFSQEVVAKQRELLEAETKLNQCKAQADTLRKQHGKLSNELAQAINQRVLLLAVPAQNVVPMDTGIGAGDGSNLPPQGGPGTLPTISPMAAMAGQVAKAEEEYATLSGKRRNLGPDASEEAKTKLQDTLDRRKAELDRFKKAFEAMEEVVKGSKFLDKQSLGYGSPADVGAGAGGLHGTPVGATAATAATAAKAATEGTVTKVPPGTTPNPLDGTGQQSK